MAGYQVADDYLDQHGGRTRQDRLGPPSMWDALTARDLTRLGQTAHDRGLCRHAAALRTATVALGGASAACQLVGQLRQFSPEDVSRALRWAVDHVSLDNLQGPSTG